MTLDQAISYHLRQGDRLEQRTDDTAIVARGRPVNNILHLLLTIFTAGLWLFVWLAISAFGGEQRYAIERMPDGEVEEYQISGRRLGGLILKLALGLVALFVLFSIIAALSPGGVRAMPIPAGVSNVCSGGQWTQAQAMSIARRPLFTSTSMEYVYRGLATCTRSGQVGGQSAVYLNLSSYDRRKTAGGNLLQVGIWRRDTDAHALFVYTPDNSGGGLTLFSAPYPHIGHLYVFSIDRDGANWRIRIVDETLGVIVHEVYETAHWARARSAWMMFETYDHASPFAAGRLTRFTVDGQVMAPPCSVRDIYRPDPYGSYVLYSSSATCIDSPTGFTASR